jgi:zinc transporter 2
MSNEFNILSLNRENDQKEPLIAQNEMDEFTPNFIENIKTITHCETKVIPVENPKTEKNEKVQFYSSSEDESSIVEKNAELFKKQQDIAIRKLIWVCVICTIFMTIEIIGGYLANSIAIMSDAAHLLSDLLGFLISIISIYISRKVAKNNMSYGYHRAEIIGALVSIVLIWALTLWLLYEATLRIIIPPQVDGFIMIIISIIGFSFNVIMGLVLAKSGVAHSHGLHKCDHDHDHEHEHGHKHEHEHEHSSDEEIKLHTEDEHEEKNTNVNLRASFIHILGDAIQNIGVFIAGLIIYFFPNYSIADPICTYLFSIIVGFTTINILRDCIFVLMEGSPVDIDIDELENDLKEIKGVKEIHDLHVWSLSIGKTSLSCHICCDNPQKTLKKAKKMIQKKYKIDHITIQVEDNNNMNQLSCKNDIHK